MPLATSANPCRLMVDSPDSAYPLPMTRMPEATFGMDEPPMTSRTSVLAVLSLIAGLLSLLGCCLIGISPAVGVVGGVLGAIAIFKISSSQGRLGGMGLAIGGVVTSLISVVLGIVIVIGASGALKSFDPYGNAINVAQSNDQSGLTKVLSTAALAKLTPEGLTNFRTKTQSELGAFKEVKPGLLTFVQNLGPGVAKAQASLGTSGKGEPPPLPFVSIFDKGSALIFVVLEPNNGVAPDPAAPFGKLANLGVVTPSNNEIVWLVDPKATPSLPGATPVPQPPSTVKPDQAPAAPASEPAKEPAHDPATPPPAPAPK